MEDMIVMVDGIPTFNPVMKTIPAFNKIITSSRKETGQYKTGLELANKKLAYVFFMEHYMSSYLIRFPNNEQDRDAAIRKHFKLEDWDALKDEDILEAREVFREPFSESSAWRLLKIALMSVELIINQFEIAASVADSNSKDLTKRPEHILAKAKEVGDVIANLKKLQDEVKANVFGGKIIGQKIKNVFEDPSGSSIR